MNISFEIASDKVCVDDLVAAVKPTGVATRICSSMTLGKYGPRPVLMVVFDRIGDRNDPESLTLELAERLKLAGIEVENA